MLFVDGGKEATDVLDSMSEAVAPASDPADTMDPYNDHPEAMEAIRRGDTVSAGPEGMNLTELPVGVIP